MTFSILARDPVTNELGVAVFIASPFVGVRVPWAQVGVGAVATQAKTERGFGPAGLK